MLLVLLLILPAAVSAKVERLVVFGDSLSDNGVNLNDKYGITRYTDGFVWNEYLAEFLELELVTYACAGAHADIERNIWVGEGQYFKAVSWGGIAWQVNQYLKDVQGIVPPSDLVVYQMAGVNDIMMELQRSRGSPSRDLGRAIGVNNSANVARLVEKGATNVLVLNAVPLDKALYAAKKLPKDYSIALVTDMNEGFRATNMVWTKNYPDAKLILVDMLEFFKHESETSEMRMAAAPPDGESKPFERLQYFFMPDGLHPTDRAHRAFAQFLKPIARNIAAPSGAARCPAKVKRSSDSRSPTCELLGNDLKAATRAIDQLKNRVDKLVENQANCTSI